MFLQPDVVQLQLEKHLLINLQQLVQGIRLQRRGSKIYQQKTRRWLERKLIGRSIERYALLMGAQIKPRKEECALNMVLRSSDAVVKDAQAMLKEEACALSMGQNRRSNYATVKDAQI